MAQRDSTTWRGNERLDDEKSRTSTEPRDRHQQGRSAWIVVALVMGAVLVGTIAYMAAMRW